MINRAKAGDRVRVEFVSLAEDAAKTRPEPQVLEFTVGSDEVIPGLSMGVVGMASGEEKRFTLQPQDAYGPVRRELVKEVPRRRFPKHLKLSVGKRLTAVGVTSRRRRQVYVVQIKPSSVVVDGNHPLAGKVVVVDVQLVALNSPSPGPGKAPRKARGKG